MEYEFFGPSPSLDKAERNITAEYGTTNSETINLMKQYADKKVKSEADSKAQALINDMLPAIKEKARADALKQVRNESRLSEGVKIYDLSPFISEIITINGTELNRSHFIPDRIINDPVNEDVKLFFEDQNDRWVVIVKCGLPKLISRFVVVACLIVDAAGPGTSRAYVVFLKGEAKPLIFWNGIIDASELRKQTQFHQKGFSYARKDLYYESFIRSLAMCKAVYFLTLPKHAGWNTTPRGIRVFVHSGMMNPKLNGLFLNKDSDNKNKMHNIFLDISLEKSACNFKDIVAKYHSLIPDILPLKISTVLSITSRFLPHYKEEGLTQDRLWVVETADSDTAKIIIAVMQNKNHSMTDTLLSSMRLPYIEEEIKKYIDCAVVIRHTHSICSMHDYNKILKYLFEWLQNDTHRLIPVLFTDNAGIIQEELRIHQLSLTEKLGYDNIEQIQQIIGELDYLIVKITENNPDAVKQILKAAITTANEMSAELPSRSQSNSAIMFLSTAILFHRCKLFTDSDVQAMLKWLSTEAKERTAMSRYVKNAVGVALSNAICSVKLPIAKQYGPPFWTPDSAFIAVDDSINVTKDTLYDDIFTDLSVGRNTALKCLQDEDILFKDKESKGGQKTWTVENEDGSKKPRRFYSFSRDLLTSEANRAIDEAITSDLFHKLDNPINNFFPFIKHPRLNMFAGQIITDYKHGNNFIAVTGTPGSGKTDWIMMQMLQRAKAGDVVVVLDPTNAVCRDELSGHKIPDEIINELFEFWDITTQGLPVNILDFEGCKDITQRAQRLSSLLISGMHLTGQNQKDLVKAKTEEWLTKFETDNTLSIYTLPSKFAENAEERKIKTKLEALLSTVKNVENEVQSPGWEKLLSDRGKVLVVSYGNATINVDANPFDVLLDTLYSFKDKQKEDTMTVILDEAQTMNHHKDSTLVNILSRIRKLNISVLLASQDYLNSSLQKVYDYCGTHILFRPLGEECIKTVAEFTKLDANIIRTLPDFNCAILGAIYSEYYKKNIQLSSAIVGETYRPPYVGNYDDE